MDGDTHACVRVSTHTHTSQIPATTVDSPALTFCAAQTQKVYIGLTLYSSVVRQVKMESRLFMFGFTWGTSFIFMLLPFTTDSYGSAGTCCLRELDHGSIHGRLLTNE